MDNQQNKPQGPQLQIEVAPEVAQGVYSNFAIISHTSSEFFVDLAAMMPGVPKATVRSRVILAPEHAKRLAMALQENIAKYEQESGEYNSRTGSHAPSHPSTSTIKVRPDGSENIKSKGRIDYAMTILSLIYVNKHYKNINQSTSTLLLQYIIRIFQLKFVPLQPKMVCRGMPSLLCIQLNNNIIIKKLTKCLQFRN